MKEHDAFNNLDEYEKVKDSRLAKMCKLTQDFLRANTRSLILLLQDHI